MALILVIDDSVAQRAGIRAVLESDRHEVIEAADGRDGLEKVARYLPDLVLCDLLMPEMSGYEFLQILRQRGSTVPVLLLTSVWEDRLRNPCLELGADDLIPKPIRRNEFRALLGTLRKSGRKG